MRTRITVFLALLCMFLRSETASANDYFVDAVNGSDATGDGSAQSPWQTITYSFSQIPGPDDTLWVEPGVYDAALGEVFPLTPMPKVSLVSLAGREVTRIVGDGVNDLIVLPGADQVNPSRPLIEGFTLENAHDAIVLREGHAELIALTLRSSTVTNNSRAGVYLGSGLWSNGVKVIECSISQNLYGVLMNGATSEGSGLELEDSLIENNLSHGIAIVDGFLFARSDRDVIRNNGGAGWWQTTTLEVQSSLTNTTISGNAGGGFYAHADVQGTYPYHFYPVSQIGALACIVYGNSGFGGALEAGTAGGIGQVTNSIAWGNSPVDNVNFKAVYSDVGTGQNFGSGVISIDPRFVDALNGDFRFRHDSPCIDTANNSASPRTDFEGQPRPFDGNSDGTARADMGIDEFTACAFPAGPAKTGQPFSFQAEAPPAEDGHLVVLLLAGATAGEGPGIPLPGSGGLRVDLESDALFQLGLRLHPVLQATLANSQAQTPPVTIPSTAPLIEVFYAGFTFDLTAGTYVTVFPPHSFTIEPGP